MRVEGGCGGCIDSQETDLQIQAFLDLKGAR